MVITIDDITQDRLIDDNWLSCIMVMNGDWLMMIIMDYGDDHD